MADEARPIIIKRIKKISGGAHGGAWKVAYADFVTAMMAFFLLLWLLSATTEEQRLGIADYFSPEVASTTTSGSQNVLGGQSVVEEGAKSSGSVLVSVPNTPPVIKKTSDDSSDKSKDSSDNDRSKPDYAEQMIAKQEEALFLEAQQEIEDAVDNNPDLKDLRDNIVIDQTPDGMRIQVVDKEGHSLWRKGSPTMNENGRKILAQIAATINEMPNRIAISGHTDGIPLRGKAGYTNWELSADRANTTRRELLSHNFPRDRIFSVAGKADTEPLLPDNPYLPTNRRITILLMREAPVLPPSYNQ